MLCRPILAEGVSSALREFSVLTQCDNQASEILPHVLVHVSGFKGRGAWKTRSTGYQPFGSKRPALFLIARLSRTMLLSHYGA
jgi:hypothetical protein